MVADIPNVSVGAKLTFMAGCKHSWMCHGRILALDTILDDWLGPTRALLHCEGCGHPALLHLVSWRGNVLAERIFAIRLVDRRTMSTYLTNINRDYCDLTRKASETEALICSCSQNAKLVLVTGPEMIVEAFSRDLFNPPIMDWQDIKTESYEGRMKFLPR